MEKQFEILTTSRKNILKEIEGISPKALFEIPKGFNNHILWNTMHVIASQQLLIYGLSQTPFHITTDMVTNYRSGSVPSKVVNLDIIEFAKKHLLSTVNQLQEDYQNKKFGSFKAISTSYGLVLNDIEDAIRFNNIHEAMHYGQIKMLKKIINA